MKKQILCRAKFMLPLTANNPNERIQDGYVLSEGEIIKEVGAYSDEIGKRLLETYGDSLYVMGQTQTGDIPMLNTILMPAFKIRPRATTVSISLPSAAQITFSITLST
ncbi:hypothetical protein KJ708_07130, partial [bacterium]|nr:hypothetical protein [bacterium]